MDRLADGRRRRSFLTRLAGHKGRLAVAIFGVALVGATLVSDPVRGALSRWLSGPRGSEDFANTLRAAIGGAPTRAPSAALEAACAPDVRDECGCVVTVVGEALSAHLWEPVLAHFGTIEPACRHDRRVQGLRSQALAEAGRVEAALVEAGKVLAKHPEERHAMHARALALFKKGESEAALESAKRAVALGRGEPALLLQGLVHYARGEFNQAATAFEGVLSLNPKNVEATYNVALSAHRLGRYRDAREGYLRTLRVDPDHADARYNLAVLTHSFGAVAEARHHLGQLRGVVPTGDERIQKLTALLGEAATGAEPAVSAKAKPKRP